MRDKLNQLITDLNQSSVSIDEQYTAGVVDGFSKEYPPYDPCGVACFASMSNSFFPSVFAIAAAKVREDHRTLVR